MSEIANSLVSLVSTLVEPLLDSPEELEVKATEEEDGNVLIEVSVNQDDIGKVIGRQGRIIKAIRTLTRAAASKSNVSVDVELLD